MCTGRLREVFEDYRRLDGSRHKASESRAQDQIANEFHYLDLQTHIIENKYTDVKKRVEILVNLVQSIAHLSIPGSRCRQTYALLNEKAAGAAHTQAAVSIDENRLMRTIAEQSREIALATKKDSAAMKALTLIAVVALPITIVSVSTMILPRQFHVY